MLLVHIDYEMTKFVGKSSLVLSIYEFRQSSQNFNVLILIG